MKNWYKLGKQHSHFHIKSDDKCIYAREYKSQKGYGGSLTNQLVLNFKKPSNRKNKPEWKYRIEAVNTFAREAEKLFSPCSNVSITAIPSSRHTSHPEYDNRFEDLFEELLKSRPSLSVERPIEIKQTHLASHIEGERNPKHIEKNYVWKGFSSQKPPQTLCVFDDVLTTGAHFRAVSDFLRKNKYEGQIVGIFWSRTIYPKGTD